MRYLRHLLPFFAASLVWACGSKDNPVSTHTTPDPPSPPVTPVDEVKPIDKWGLKDLAQACGLMIGAEFTYGEYTADDKLKDVLKRDFEAVTFGNEMKHDQIVNASGNLVFTRADQMVGWAKDCGLQLFGHTLGWHSQQQKDYLDKIINAASDPDAAAAAVREAHAKYVDEMIRHFDVYAWDVVNEAFSDDSAGSWRSSSNTQANYHVFLWGNYFDGGTKGFVDSAFRSAQEALVRYDKKAVLYINDYNLEWNPAKLEALCSYAEKNPDVTGVGSQMHCNTDLSEDAVRKMLTRMVNTGKMVRISELDVPKGSMPNRSQADLIVTIFKLYLDIVPEAQRGGITFWGVSDKNSWLNKPENNYYPQPLLFDSAYLRKDAYLQLHNFLLERSGLNKS